MLGNLGSTGALVDEVLARRVDEVLARRVDEVLAWRAAGEASDG
jgi:hypothetical protein